MTLSLIRLGLCIAIISFFGCGDGNSSSPSTASNDSEQSQLNRHSEPKRVDQANRSILDGDTKLEFEITENAVRRIQIRGASNLPTGTNLALSIIELREGGFSQQSKCEVDKTGEFASELLGPTSGLPEGHYMVEVLMAPPQSQPDQVRLQIGLYGENLKGKIVRKNNLGISVSLNKEFTVGNPSYSKMEIQSDDVDQAEFSILYEVVKDKLEPGVKRSLEIVLKRKVTENELSKIAMELKKSSSESVPRTFIGYYLPDTDRSSGYWATTHFAPNLEVNVLGTTIAQDHEMARARNKSLAANSAEILGRWSVGGIAGREITIS